MLAVERLGDDPERLDDVLGLLGEPSEADRDEGAWIVDLTGEQRASLVLVEVEIGGGYSGVPKNLSQSGGVPRGVLANVHDGEMEPEDLGETDHIAEITVGDQIRALSAQRLVDDQEILQTARRISRIQPADLHARRANARASALAPADRVRRR